MKDYTHFTAVELAQDEDFLRWFSQDDEKLNRKWQLWLIQHPEKKEDVEEAASIIKAVIDEQHYLLPDSRQQELFARIHETLAAGKKTTRFTKRTKYAMAASISALFIVAIALYQSNQWSLAIYHNIVNQSIHRKELLQYSNESNKPYVLVLEDGSMVTLQPHSSIQYPEAFSSASRDVYLNGEAFFEVKRNPQKPFSVYSNEIVTRVLGTSFTVRAYEKERNVVVAVKTGKVSVFTEAEGWLRNSSPQNLAGALLIPNQQIIFSRDEARMVKSLVEEPEFLLSATATEDFQFVNTPIREVFSCLQNAYGVQIIFDEELMSNCFLNASSLKDLSFFDKLRLICKGINAKYEVLDAHIIITGDGCK